MGIRWLSSHPRFVYFPVCSDSYLLTPQAMLSETEEILAGLDPKLTVCMHLYQIPPPPRHSSLYRFLSIQFNPFPSTPQNVNLLSRTQYAVNYNYGDSKVNIKRIKQYNSKPVFTRVGQCCERE